MGAVSAQFQLACVACMHAGYVEDEHKNGTLAISPSLQAYASRVDMIAHYLVQGRCY